MAEQEVTRIKLAFEHNIKKEDVDELERLKDVLSDISKLELKDNISKPLSRIGKALQNFSDLKIGVNLGKSVTNLVEALNGITEVKDITPYVENLNKGFAALGQATSHFNEISAKIPVNLGRGVTGIVNAANQISTVKDITRHAVRLENNFKAIADATKHFNGLDTADYSGISRLVVAITNVSKIKPLDNTVIHNAEKLAKAINILGKDTEVSVSKMEAMSDLAKNIGVNFRDSKRGVDDFSKSLRLLNFDAVIRNIRLLIRGLKNLVSNIYSTVDAFGDVQNTLSFFGQSLGSESDRIARIIQQYATLGAVDFAQFANQTAILNQMYRSYGFAAETAANMALSMTQLAYDASYALGENGKDIQRWFDLITSFSVGQTKAGYRFGVDASIKTLQQEFDGLSNASDKMTKFWAAYNVIMEQTVAIQGQLPREFRNTYVQMEVLRNRVRQLKQSIGQSLVPMFEVIIQWGLVALEVITLVIDALVKLFGGEGFKIINYADLIADMKNETTGLSAATKDVADGMANANKQAKELKKTISGIDQVFTINDRKDTDRSIANLSGITGIGIDTPFYTWLDDLANDINIGKLEEAREQAQQIFNNIKEAVPFVVSFGVGLLAWKISKGFLDALKYISGMKNIFGGLGLDKFAGISGLLLLAGDLTRLKGYIEDFMESGPTFANVSGILSTFVGTIGDIAILTGNVQLGGILKLVQGVADIAAAIKLMSDEGINWENTNRLLLGISNIVIGAGLISKNWEAVGIGIAFQGIIMMVNQLKELVNAIQTGNWENFDKVELIIGGLMTIGGLALAIGKFKKTVDLANKGSALTKASDAFTKVSSATGGITSTLINVAKNLALGVLIIAEVVVAVLIFVKGIELLGEGLEKVGIAWKPVIENGKDIAIAIGIGTGFLVAIGVVTFALGSATIAGAGALPLAIAAGTTMLALLTVATIAFIVELTAVGNELTNRLHPAMSALNEVLPELTENTRSFTSYMIEFAGHVVAYSGASTVAGIGGAINTIVGWFVKDPIKQMTDDAIKNKKQFSDLNDALGVVNPLVKKADSSMGLYMDLLNQLKESAEKAKSLGTMPNIGVDFKEFSKSLKTGFSDLDSIKTRNIENIMSTLKQIDLNRFKGLGTEIVKAMELGINNYVFNFNSAITKIRGTLTFSSTSIGTGIASGVVNGINNQEAKVTTFVNKIKTNLVFSGNSIGANIASGVISGINSNSANVSTFTNKLKTNMLKAFDIKSPSKWAKDIIGANIGLGVEEGINKSKPSLDIFKDNMSKSLFDIADDIEITPKVTMPTFDTRKINSNITDIGASLNAKVSGQFDYSNDGTEKAVEDLTVATIERLEKLIEAVENGKVMVVDGEVLGEIADKHIKGKSVRLNTVFNK